MDSNTNSKHQKREYSVFSEALKSTVEKIIKFRKTNLEKIIATGYGEVDILINHFQPKELVVIGGCPSMGKSILMANIAGRIVSKLIVGVFTIETSKEEFMTRLILDKFDIPYYCLHPRYEGYSESLESDPLWNDFNKQEKDEIFKWDREAIYYWQKFTNDVGELSDKLDKENNSQKLFVDDTAKTLIQIKTRIKKMVQDDHVNIVFIDNLQSIIPPDTHLSRKQQLRDITGELKHLAKELNIVVVLLVHLGYEVEQRAEKKPQLSDLSALGELDRVADIVLFLYRPYRYLQEKIKRKHEKFLDNVFQKRMEKAEKENKNIWDNMHSDDTITAEWDAMETKRSAFKKLATIIVSKNCRGSTDDVCLSFNSERPGFNSVGDNDSLEFQKLMNEMRPLFYEVDNNQQKTSVSL